MLATIFKLMPYTWLVIRSLFQDVSTTPVGWIDLVLEKPIHLVVILGLALAVVALWRSNNKKDAMVQKANDRAHAAHVEMLKQLNHHQISVLEKLDEMKDHIRSGGL